MLGVEPTLTPPSMAAHDSTRERGRHQQHVGIGSIDQKKGVGGVGMNG